MKIQCDVCEKAPATVICCADEAALCASCDVEVHAANKLASKHQRLLLEWLSNKLPRCDICQEKAAFIFCVEDRALFCRDCDEPLHVPGSHSGSHQRFLATGIRVALTDDSAANPSSEPPNDNPQLVAPALQQAPPPFTPSAWAVDDFLQLSDYESSADKKEPSVGFGELDWFTDISLFQDPMAAAEVPELTVPQANNAPFYRPSKSSMPFKKQRIEMVSNDDEYFTVPDLG